MKGTMKVWILVAILGWSVATHSHVMANNAQPEQASAEGGPVKNNKAPLPFSIVGLNDLCLVAYRNLVSLAECNNDEIKQKWNLYADGSIRTQQNNSNCLTANDLSIGSGVLILPCSTDLTDYQIWQIKEADQAIMNLHSGLALDVLGARPDWPQIVLWTPNGLSNQRWRLKLISLVAEQTKPTIQIPGLVEGKPEEPLLPFFIVGLNNLCLVANRNIANLVDCNKDEIKQKWSLYADGSIRTQQNNNCLTANDVTIGSGILILPCSPDLSDYQIWQIKEADEAIMNLHSGLALDVAGSKIDFPQLIILWSHHGGNNQRWQPKLFPPSQSLP